MNSIRDPWASTYKLMGRNTHITLAQEKWHFQYAHESCFWLMFSHLLFKYFSQSLWVFLYTHFVVVPDFFPGKCTIGQGGSLSKPKECCESEWVARLEQKPVENKNLESLQISLTDGRRTQSELSDCGSRMWIFLHSSLSAWLQQQYAVLTSVFGTVMLTDGRQRSATASVQ